MTAAGSEHLIIGTTKLANISVQFVANKGENKINLTTFAAQNQIHMILELVSATN